METSFVFCPGYGKKKEYHVLCNQFIDLGPVVRKVDKSLSGG
jgi:hypothetical protein